MRKQILLAAVAVATTASLATAQLGRNTLFIDLETAALPAGNVYHLGCAYDQLNNRIYTTARSFGGAAPAGAAPHSIYLFQTNGTFVSSQGQTAASDATVWGYRDGASSLVGQVMFGWDGGIDVYDVDPGTGALTAATILIASGGATALTGTITSAAVGGTHRALAYNFYGDGGNGSFFTGSFGSDVFEIDAAGNLLNQFPNTSSVVWSSYGFALDDKGDTDETNDTLWINSAPNASNLVEYAIDRTIPALIPTGLEIVRNQATSAQGGLALVPGGLDGRNCGFDLIAVDQGAPDALTGYRVVQWDGVDPATEPQIVVGVDGGALSAGTADVDINTTSLEVGLFSPGGTAPLGILYGAVAGFAPRPPGPLPVVGDSVWEFAFPNLSGIQIGTLVAGTPISFPNFLAPEALGTEIVWQAYCIDLSVPATACGKNLTFVGLPWTSTNFGSHERVIDPPTDNDIATIRTNGANSFNADPLSGFFSITADANSAGDPIVAVTLDFTTSSNPMQAGTVFDTDQGGMADAFWNGNAGGCIAPNAGTYRNGSDVTVGLDYGNINNNIGGVGASVCATSVPHCEGTNVTIANSYGTLKWRFAPGSFLPGETFEFDCDTDGGSAGTNGGAGMVGLVVTVETVSGAIYTGELALDVPVNSCVIEL